MESKHLEFAKQYKTAQLKTRVKLLFSKEYRNNDVWCKVCGIIRGETRTVYQYTILMDDRVPCHRRKIVQNSLNKINVTILTCTVNRPDLKSIENL